MKKFLGNFLKIILGLVLLGVLWGIVRIINVVTTWPKARAEVRLLLRDYKGALTDYERVLSSVHNEQSRAKIKLKLSKIKYEMEDYEAARAEAVYALEKLVHDSDRYRAYNALCHIERSLDNSEKMVEYCTLTINLAQSLQKKPTDAYAFRGLAFYKLGKYEESKNDYTQAIVLSPEGPAFYLGRAKAELKLGNYAGVIADTNTLLEKDSRTFSRFLAYRYRCEAGLRLEDSQEVINDCSQGISLATEVPDNASELYDMRGEVFYGLGNYEKALDDFTQAVNLLPNNSMLYAKLARVKFKLRNYDEVDKDFARAIQLDPRNSLIYYLRYSVRHEQKDYQGALADLNRAIEIDPTIEIFYRKRSAVREQLKDYKGALEDLKQAEYLLNN